MLAERVVRDSFTPRVAFSCVDQWNLFSIVPKWLHTNGRVTREVRRSTKRLTRRARVEFGTADLNLQRDFRSYFAGLKTSTYGDDDHHLLRVGFGAGTFVVSLGLLYVAARVVHEAFLLFKYTAPIYERLDVSKQRNVVTYVLEIIITSVQLPWVMTLLVQLWWRDQFRIDEHLRDQGELNALLLSGLFVFELLYRVETPWQLLVHHAAAILLMLAALIRGEEHGTPVGSDTVIWVIALVVTLTALTEQPVFVALLMYRFDTRPVFTSWLFKVSAFQNFLCKIGLNVAATTLWAQATFKQDPIFGGSYLAQKPAWSDDAQRTWWLILWPMLGIAMLLPAQMIAVRVQWQLGTRTTKRSMSSLSLSDTLLEARSAQESEKRPLVNHRRMNMSSKHLDAMCESCRDVLHQMHQEDLENSSDKTNESERDGMFRKMLSRFLQKEDDDGAGHDMYVLMPDFNLASTETGGSDTDNESTRSTRGQISRSTTPEMDYIQGLSQSVPLPNALHHTAERTLSCRSAIHNTAALDSDSIRFQGGSGPSTHFEGYRAPVISTSA
eukprot:g58327.t1